MAEKVEFEIGAIDNASRTVSEIFNHLQSGASASSIALGVAGIAFSASMGILVGSINEFIKYSEEVKNFARNTGTTVEEASRLIQVADDVRLSSESMTTAMKILATHGIDPSIESLKKLADEYIALQPGAERTTFLIDNFGRSGLEMGKLLEQGSKGIESLNNGISKKLILDENSLAKAEALKKAQDDLADSWQGLMVQLGSDALPTVTYLVEKLTNGLQGVETAVDKVSSEHERNSKILKYANTIYDEQNSAAGKVVLTWGEAKVKAEELVRQEELYAEQGRVMNEVADKQAKALGEVGGKAEMTTEEIKNMTDANNSLLSLTMSLQSEQDSYSENMASAIQKQQEMKIALDETIAAHAQNPWKTTAEDVQTATEKYNDASTAIDELNAKHQDAMNSIAYGLFNARLQADGFTDAEFQMSIQAGIALGQIDQATADLAIKYNDLANSVKDDPMGAQKFAEGAKQLSDASTSVQGISNSIGRNQAVMRELQSASTTAGSTISSAIGSTSRPLEEMRTNIGRNDVVMRELQSTSTIAVSTMQDNFDSFTTDSAIDQIQQLIDAINSIPPPPLPGDDGGYPPPSDDGVPGNSTFGAPTGNNTLSGSSYETPKIGAAGIQNIYIYGNVTLEVADSESLSLAGMR